MSLNKLSTSCETSQRLN